MMKDTKSVIFNLRMTPDQVEYIHEQAKKLDLNISQYLRLLISVDKKNDLTSKMRIN
jgi:hypothetical protein